MPDHEADWKAHEQHVLDWVVAGIVAVLVACYAYLGVTGENSIYLALAGLLAGGVGLFFTRYWQAILYVPGVLVVTAVSVVWLLQGAWVESVRIVAILANVGFAVVAVYLLLYEDPIL